jgi:hypothetical protein
MSNTLMSRPVSRTKIDSSDLKSDLKSVHSHTKDSATRDSAHAMHDQDAKNNDAESKTPEKSMWKGIVGYISGIDRTPYMYGAVLGMIFYSALGYADKQMDNPYRKLDPEPSSFDMDPHLYDLFDKMAVFRSYAERDYTETLRMTDRLLSIERALEHGAEPRVIDVPQAQHYFEQAMKHALELKLSIVDSTNLAYYKSYQQILFQRLSQHLADIARRVKTQHVPKPVAASI